MGDVPSPLPNALSDKMPATTVPKIVVPQKPPEQADYDIPLGVTCG